MEASMTDRNGWGRSNGFAADLFRPLPDRYDWAAEVLSFGQNARWRRRMIDRIVEADPQVTCDVATGTAGVALQLIKRTNTRVVALDLSQEMIRRGRANTVWAGVLDRIDFVLGTGERLPFRDSTFDALTFTYLFRYVADPAETLCELVRVLKRGGRIATLEFSVPPHPVWRSLWWFHTRAVLPVAGLFVGKGWFDVGRFLGPSISQHWARYPIGVQETEWRSAGIERFGYEQMSLGAGVVMWGTKR
jgi:demethylmenaquinone methyltransferase / 2-methoxy-6-polyprenyl-1,4-benzoquinol methylase